MAVVNEAALLIHSPSDAYDLEARYSAEIRYRREIYTNMANISQADSSLKHLATMKLQQRVMACSTHAVMIPGGSSGSDAE